MFCKSDVRRALAPRSKQGRVRAVEKRKPGPDHIARGQSLVHPFRSRISVTIESAVLVCLTFSCACSMPTSEISMQPHLPAALRQPDRVASHSAGHVQCLSRRRVGKKLIVSAYQQRIGRPVNCAIVHCVFCSREFSRRFPFSSRYGHRSGSTVHDEALSRITANAAILLRYTGTVSTRRKRRFTWKPLAAR